MGALPLVPRNPVPSLSREETAAQWEGHRARACHPPQAEAGVLWGVAALGPQRKFSFSGGWGLAAASCGGGVWALSPPGGS